MNLQENLPIISRDRLTACETAIGLDEAALFGTSNVVTDCDISLSTLAAPAAPTLAVVGTAGTTSIGYRVADVGNVGVSPSTETTTTLGNATLSATNYMAVTFIGISGHTYNLYRSTAAGTPSTMGLISTVTLTPTATAPAGSSVTVVFNDTGSVSPTGGVPTANGTGGSMVTLDLSYSAFQTVSTTAAVSLTVANVINGLLIRSGGAALTDTFPTAAALVACMPAAKVNSYFQLVYRNGNSGNITLSCTTGGTLAAGNTNTIASVHAKVLYVQLTNVTPGSEAFTVYTVADSAY